VVWCIPRSQTPYSSFPNGVWECIHLSEASNVHQTQKLSILFYWQRSALRKAFPNGIWERETRKIEAVGKTKRRYLTAPGVQLVQSGVQCSHRIGPWPLCMAGGGSAGCAGSVVGLERNSLNPLAQKCLRSQRKKRQQGLTTQQL